MNCLANVFATSLRKDVLFFFELHEKREENHVTVQQQTKLWTHHVCRASQITSCTDGVASSEPPGTRPNRDIENAFAAVQANNLCHRLSMLCALQPATLQVAHGPWPKQVTTRTRPFLRTSGRLPQLPARSTGPCHLRRQVLGTSVPFDVGPLPEPCRSTERSLSWPSRHGGVGTP